MNGKGSAPRKNANRKSYEKNFQNIKWVKRERFYFTKCFFKYLKQLLQNEKNKK